MGARSFKFIIYYSLFIIYSGVSVHAQVGESRTDLAVGINGGFVMNRVTFSPSVKQKLKNGMTMGFTARYTCEKYFNMLCAHGHHRQFPCQHSCTAL